MAIKAIRQIGYVGDGEYQCQCLSCYRSCSQVNFDDAEHRFNFCPFCGIRFEQFIPQKEKQLGIIPVEIYKIEYKFYFDITDDDPNTETTGICVYLDQKIPASQQILNDIKWQKSWIQKEGFLGITIKNKNGKILLEKTVYPSEKE